jgi:YVTN family beta-propeller protein
VNARRPRLLVAALALFGLPGLANTCNKPPLNDRPEVGSQLFTSPQVNPVALSCDGSELYVANTTSGTLSIVETDPPYATLAEIAVGLDPVGVAVRPKVSCGDPEEDEQVFVTNHISDSISIVSRQSEVVIQTLHELDGDGVSTTDEPVGVAFNGNGEAFVTLDRPNQIAKLAPDGGGTWSIVSRTPAIAETANPAVPADAFTAQAPRAIAVSGGRVFVASFESGNQSEFPSCGGSDPVTYDPNGAAGLGTGCEFPLNITNLLAFATNPNIGGEVVHNASIPDRDLFVYDTDLNLIETVQGVGTLLYGLTASGTSVYITHTDARNKHDGLDALQNRMFENRLAIVDCAGSCSVSSTVDLDANGFGVPVPTPYGVAASGDGQTLVVSVAGSDGVPGLPEDPSTDIPGLVTLDASGNVLGHVQTGAIPQGVALRSDGGGAAQTAFVLNTVDSTLSVVDVSNPAAPSVQDTVVVGSDPTPAQVKSGRIQFSSARASTNGTFSCESCHPNSNIDQILWTINTNLGPQDNCNGNDVCPEPRSTMPIRGLRDTLPLHWVGNLADPFSGTGVGAPEDPVSPDCDLQIDGEAGCIRDLVDASLSGVMCDQAGGCDPSDAQAGPGGSNLPGALTDAERDDMSVFLAAVSYPPSPRRRPDDTLSASATDGMDDFFTDQGGLGGMVAGQAASCANNAGGCHALPLTVSTNSPVVGGFDAPTIRGLWDRTVTFSNGITSTQPNLSSQNFDPTAPGMTEFGSLAATFPGLFTLAYGVPVTDIWSLINEMSVGLPGLTGRQLALTPGNVADPGVGTQLDQIVAAAEEGKITATASLGNRDWRYDPVVDLWLPRRGAGITSSELRAFAGDLLSGEVTVLAQLPGTLVAGGAARQPLLVASGNPDVLPTVNDGVVETITVGQSYIEPGATVYVDGQLCSTCSVVLNGGTADVELDPTPASNGVHVLQVQNPEGFGSNEFPFCVNSGC